MKESGLTTKQSQWLNHLRACTDNGESISAYAKRHGLSLSATYQAKRRLIERGRLAGGGVARWCIAERRFAVCPCSVDNRTTRIAPLSIAFPQRSRGRVGVGGAIPGRDSTRLGA